MIRIRKDEYIRRRYDAKIKGYGDGTLFLTNKRLCFESSKHGVCFNLELAHIWDWLAKKKKIRIRWQELYPGQSQIPFDSEIFSVDIELIKKNGYRADPKEVHFALFYAYTDEVKYGYDGLGWYVNEKRELHHRYDLTPQKYKTSGMREVMEVKQWQVDILEEQELLKAAGIDEKQRYELLGDFVAYGDEWVEFFKKNTGKTQFEQDIFIRVVNRKAWQKDGIFDKVYGLKTKEQIEKRLKGIASEKGMIVWGKNTIEHLRQDIAKYEKENNTEKLTEVFLPNTAKPGEKPVKYVNIFGVTQTQQRAIDIDSENTGFLPLKGGTRYDMVKNLTLDLSVYKRLEEILSQMRFEFYNQFKRARFVVGVKLLEKIEKGEDISNYVPKVELPESKMIWAEKHITEYIQKAS